MTPKDFDQLSAYIDGQLLPNEKAALESRLAADPQLRTTLSELRMTVRALRALPQVKPRRSFTLTPAQVGMRQSRRPLFPALRLAAAVSAMALVMVVVGDVAVTTGLFPGATAGGSESQMFTSAEAPAATSAPEATLETMAELAPPDDPGVEASSAPEDATMESFAVTDQGVAGASEEENPDARQTEATPDAAALAPASTPSGAESKTSPTAQPETAAGATPTPDAFAIAAAPEATDSVSPPAGDGAQLYDAPPSTGVPPLRIVQAALAVLTLGLAIGAWVTRRGA